jgi:hypothetical protein
MAWASWVIALTTSCSPCSKHKIFDRDLHSTHPPTLTLKLKLGSCRRVKGERLTSLYGSTHIQFLGGRRPRASSCSHLSNGRMKGTLASPSGWMGAA